MASREAIVAVWRACRVSGMRCTWPSDEDDVAMSWWEKCFEDVDDDQLGDATLSYTMRCKFWPTIAELRAFVAPHVVRPQLDQENPGEIGPYSRLAEADGRAAIALLDRLVADNPGICDDSVRFAELLDEAALRLEVRDVG